MLRTFALIAWIMLLNVVLCDCAVADPDQSIVSAGFNNDSSTVTVSGRSRIDLVSSVLRGLENCDMSADSVTVGPWLHLPDNALEDSDERPRLTVFVSDRIEGGLRAAYICLTPKFPFSIVAAVARELREAGFSDIRLLSDETFRTELLELSSHPPSNRKTRVATEAPESIEKEK